MAGSRPARPVTGLITLLLAVRPRSADDEDVKVPSRDSAATSHFLARRIALFDRYSRRT